MSDVPGNDQTTTQGDPQSPDGGSVVVKREGDGHSTQVNATSCSPNSAPINLPSTPSHAGSPQVHYPGPTFPAGPSFTAATNFSAGPCFSAGPNFPAGPSTSYEAYHQQSNYRGPTFQSVPECAPPQNSPSAYKGMNYPDHGNMCAWPSFNAPVQQCLPLQSHQSCCVCNFTNTRTAVRGDQPGTSGAAMQGVVKKRGPGRPPKQKRTDEAFEPFLKKNKADEQTCNDEPFLPKRTKDDVHIPSDKKSRCSKCRQWVARYILEPCYHYGFCVSCLAEERMKNKANGKHQSCPASGNKITKYRLAFKCTILNTPLISSDSD